MRALMLLCVSVMCEKCEMEMRKQNGLKRASERASL